MKAYSTDLRQKIVDAYNAREGSYRQLAKRFRVSVSFVQTLLTRYQETGQLEPIPHSARETQKEPKPQSLDRIQGSAAMDRDALLDELCETLYQKTQLRISRTVMSKLLPTHLRIETTKSEPS